MLVAERCDVYGKCRITASEKPLNFGLQVRYFHIRRIDYIIGHISYLAQFFAFCKYDLLGRRTVGERMIPPRLVVSPDKRSVRSFYEQNFTVYLNVFLKALYA